LSVSETLAAHAPQKSFAYRIHQRRLHSGAQDAEYRRPSRRGRTSSLVPQRILSDRAAEEARSQDRRIYAKAKAEPTWRFRGLYVHICKKETLQTAYEMARHNDGAPGIDGVTFEAIEKSDVERFVEQLRDELVSHQYRPMRNRRRAIPKDRGKTRMLSIPAIRDRVVQGALKLILEPIFEADFQPGSYGYRPKRLEEVE
jgi:RNA-directed DNA polymerase